MAQQTRRIVSDAVLERGSVTLVTIGASSP